MSDGVTLSLGFGAVLAGVLLSSAGLRNRSLSEIVRGITSPNVNVSSAQAAPVPPAGAASPSSSGHVSPTAKGIRGFFEGKGLTRAQAAGIVGNLQQESGLNPNAPGGGLDQGQGSRAHSGSLTAQLEAIWSELVGSESGTLHALRRAVTPQQAARIFSERFERPGIPMLTNRERYALEAAK